MSLRGASSAERVASLTRGALAKPTFTGEGRPVRRTPSGGDEMYSSFVAKRQLAAAVLATAVLAGATATRAAAAPGFGPLDAASCDRQLENTLGGAYAGFWMDGTTRRVAITDTAE